MDGWIDGAGENLKENNMCVFRKVIPLLTVLCGIVLALH